jgi:hypothetical protein
MKYFALPILFLCAFLGSSAFADEIPRKLGDVQRALYAESFQSFVNAVQIGIPAVHTISNPVAPAYDPSASRNDWVNAFATAISTQSHLSATDNTVFEAAVQNIFFGYSNNEPYGKVNFLAPALNSDNRSSQGWEVESVKSVRLLKRYPSPHTMDLSAYVNQRFARPIQEFIKKNRVPFFGHDSNCDDAITYHRSQGFSVIERYSSEVDGPLPPNFIAYNPRSQAYRFGVCDLIGKDDVTRITEILGPIFWSNDAYLVHHKVPEPLFNLNEKGSSLKFTPNDRVFIGYQNTIWWALHTSAAGGDWQRIPLSSGGLATDLFYNQKTGQQLVSVANCYGDEMRIALRVLYEKGARRFVYFGTAGGLDPSLKVGDVLIPTRFRFRLAGSRKQKLVSFRNSAMKLSLKAAPDSQLKLGSQQDWVPTLVEESVTRVTSMRTAGSQAMDVESRYMGEFFATHKATEKTAVIIVSDLPLGGETYVDAGAHRGSDIDSVNVLLSQILEN